MSMHVSFVWVRPRGLTSDGSGTCEDRSREMQCVRGRGTPSSLIDTLVGIIFFRSLVVGQAFPVGVVIHDEMSMSVGVSLAVERARLGRGKSTFMSATIQDKAIEIDPPFMPCHR